MAVATADMAVVAASGGSTVRGGIPRLKWLWIPKIRLYMKKKFK